MSKHTGLLTQNLGCAVRRFGHLTSEHRDVLRVLTTRFLLSVASGDLTLIDGKWYVTHSGLLQIARRNHCSGIETKTVPQFCDPNSGCWVVKAIVYKSAKCKGFVGYGDADPSNISFLVRGAELRIAETRAVNRALRKAYGIGLCSVEELGTAEFTRKTEATDGSSQTDGNSQPSLRDRLLLLIRQHQLDPAQVKQYAARFCGTESIRQASREQIEKFVDHLNTLVKEDPAKLRAELATAAPVSDTDGKAKEAA